MANESFFEDIFGDPADDPLLESGDAEEGEGGREGKETGRDRPEEPSGPSWTSRSEDAHQDDLASEAGRFTNGPRSSGAGGAAGDEESPPTEKTVAVEVGQTEGLEEVNRSLEGGWRLISVCLEKGEKAGGKHLRRSQASGKRVLMTLRREGATSLFDFG
jgi:hypothetical protein